MMIVATFSSACQVVFLQLSSSPEIVVKLDVGIRPAW